jgi:four helix bundle protein
MSAQFDHEKLDVYQVALQFVAWVTPLMEESRASGSAAAGEVRDQLDRASLSILLNTAEGNGKRQNRSRAKFFDDARGSTTECAACLDAMVAKGLCSGGRVAEGKQMLLRVASMLTKLVDRFSGDGMVREDTRSYGQTVEHEDEDDDEDDRKGPTP